MIALFAALAVAVHPIMLIGLTLTAWGIGITLGYAFGWDRSRGIRDEARHLLARAELEAKHVRERDDLQAWKESLAPYGISAISVREADPAAPRVVAELPRFWDRRRELEGKPDTSRCAAELRRALLAETKDTQPGE